MRASPTLPVASLRRRIQILSVCHNGQFFRGYFVAQSSADRFVVESDSLLLSLPVMLGKQLPESVRSKMIADLKQPGPFLTSNGLATGRLGSPTTNPTDTGADQSGRHRH